MQGSEKNIVNKKSSKNNTLEEKLVQAAIDENLTDMESLLKKGANPNYLTLRYRDEDLYPMDEKYLKSSLDIVISTYEPSYDNATKAAKLLLEYGADVNGGDSRMPPLHEAIQSNSYELTELFLKNGADVNKKGELDLTPLHVASGGFGSFASPMLFDLLIQYGAEKSINEKDELGRTPAHQICIYNEGASGKQERAYILKKLTSLGADLEIPDILGNTALVLAQNRDDLKQPIMEGMIERNQSFNEDNIQTKMDVMNDIIEAHLSLRYPDHILEYKLHQACIDLDVDKISFLLESGADPDFKDFSIFHKKEQIAPLNLLANHMFHSFDKAFESITLILNHGANPNSVDLDGNTALHAYAKSYNHKACEKAFNVLMSTDKVDLNVQNVNGDTPAHLLLTKIHKIENLSYYSKQEIDSYITCITKLSDAKADLSIINNEGKSVLELVKGSSVLEAILEPKNNLSEKLSIDDVLFSDNGNIVFNEHGMIPVEVKKIEAITPETESASIDIQSHYLVQYLPSFLTNWLSSE